MGGFIQERNLLSYDDSILQPIITQSGRTRMCYELCTSGLGGAACGDSCFDLIPLNLPVSGSSQVQNTTTADSGVKYNATTRADSCDVLCKNGLGYPLCSCTNVEKSATTDFFEICTVFCVSYNYQVSFGLKYDQTYRPGENLLVRSWKAKASQPWAKHFLRASPFLN